jgi:hypothetical protein
MQHHGKNRWIEHRNGLWQLDRCEDTYELIYGATQGQILNWVKNNLLDNISTLKNVRKFLMTDFLNKRESYIEL